VARANPASALRLKQVAVSEDLVAGRGIEARIFQPRYQLLNYERTRASKGQLKEQNG